MSLKSEINLINTELKFVNNIFLSIIDFIPSFEIAESDILPYGLRPHNRSINWFAEQTIKQQTKFNANKLGVDKVDYDIPNNYLHNIVLTKNAREYFVKIKFHSEKVMNYQHTIASTAKTFLQYKSNPNYRLIYATFGTNFENRIVTFNSELLNAFSTQFLPFSISPKTDKIKASFQHRPIYRTRNEFLNLLAEKSVAITTN